MKSFHFAPGASFLKLPPEWQLTAFSFPYLRLCRSEQLNEHSNDIGIEVDASAVADMLDGLLPGLPGTSKDRALVGSVVALAYGLEMGMLGENIETEAQLGALKALGCSVGQGYLLGRPIPAEDGMS
ncbi:EAL domain-containing protein [Deinococcus marmoris]|uniref:EAL domain-containing protein n=1 Tax=Deinococcus marmoris TaxID=249408 RepID=UPI000494E19C|nr:EAL domain-containing protein [Deinococcus marmoris]